MKRILTLLILVLAAAHLNAQRDLSERRPIWFGVTMGGTWQTDDMKPVGGIGWGITVARYSRISSPSPIYWGWRFRFLDGRNFGYTYHNLYGINNNNVLSPYSSGSDPDTGSVYANYKNRFDEFAFEMILGSNTLRKHGVLLYGFGGVGMNLWKTTTNLTDDVHGGTYNYASITDNGNESSVHDQLHNMMDDTYETNAKGSVAGGQWGFMPSAGIGFGYQWSNFAIMFEHRTTWARTDLLDGIDHSSAGAGTGGNDIYHYDGLTLKWNFNSHHDNSDNPPPPPPPNPDGYTQQPPHTDPTPTPDPNQNTNTNPNPDPNPHQNQTPVAQPPTVTFTTPNVDPYVTNVRNQNLVVRVTNVTSSNQIVLTINNVTSTNFSFNPSTNTMTFTHTLQQGNNVYKVVATNNVGSAQDIQTITYKGTSDPTPPQALPPQVTITNPPADPYTSTAQTMTVNATVLNVPTSAGISITRNGSPVTQFTYNPSTQQLSFTANLQSGNNLYQVVGTNSQGSASDAVTIVYGNANVVQPPVVTITNPSACPFQTKSQTQAVSANITNVTAANQVSVVLNNQAVTNFTFTPHGSFAVVSFTASLVGGANPFTITGTNSAGSDSKSCVITYKVTAPVVVPPDVNITSPSTDPFATTNPSFTLVATVLNVGSSSEITVTSNNAIILGWTYDMNTHVLNLPTHLSTGTTVFKVTATNNNGTDNDQVSVVYREATPTVLPPTVDIYNPADNPHTVNTAAQTINATVMNVTQQSQVTVKKGTIGVPFTFDAVNHRVTFNVTLAEGDNAFTVTATNSAGTASDNVTLKLVAQPGRPGGTVTAPGPGSTTPASDPVITLVTPSTESSTTNTQHYQVTVTITGITGSQDINVRINNVPMNAGLTYNTTTHQLTFLADLVSGANTIQIRAHNSIGTTIKTLTITYTPANRVGSGSSGSGSGSSPTPVQEEKKDQPRGGAQSAPEPAPAPAPSSTPRGGSAPSGTQVRPR